MTWFRQKETKRPAATPIENDTIPGDPQIASIRVSCPAHNCGGCCALIAHVQNTRLENDTELDGRIELLRKTQTENERTIQNLLDAVETYGAQKVFNIFTSLLPI